jgi:serine/threonine-protein kinase RsbW
VPSIELKARNDLTDLPVLRDALERFGIEQGVPSKALIELQIVLDEIASNVIKYAWPQGGAHQFLVRATVDEAGGELEVIDDGRPYDPRTAPAPPRASSGRRPTPGGLGIHIVKQLVDRIDYERVGDHNRLKLMKRFIVEALPEDRGNR